MARHNILRSTCAATCAAVLLASPLGRIAVSDEATSWSADGITITDVRAAAPAGRGEAVAISMKVRNDQSRPSKIVVVDSPIASRTALQRKIAGGDETTVTHVPAVTIAGGGQEVELGPEGEHVAVIGLTRDLAPGDTFPLAMDFFPGPQLEVEVRVPEAGEAQADGTDEPALN